MEDCCANPSIVRRSDGEGSATLCTSCGEYTFTPPDRNPMTKKRHRPAKREWKEQQVSADKLVLALQHRAKELAAEGGHTLTSWQSAKRKWGKGARITWCTLCTADVLVLPNGQMKGYSKEERVSPAILGDAVMERCEAAPQSRMSWKP